jgi:hypothetical protein
MRGMRHGGPELGNGLRGGHERHARDWRRGFYDYGAYNSCLDYPPYYQRNPWDCNW